MLRPESETIIVEWPAGGHNGGEAIIGPDGYLYITTGDGTSGSDPNGTGQGVDDLLAVMMRLDVDHPDPGRNYSIPKDNPFVGMPDARPGDLGLRFSQSVAVQLRSAYRPALGRRCRSGSLGNDRAGRSRKQSSAGASWRARIRSTRTASAVPTPFVAARGRASPHRMPLDYRRLCLPGRQIPRADATSISMATTNTARCGACDTITPRRKVTWHEELADTTVKMASFGVGRDGSFYAVDYDRGQIFQLERQPPASAASALSAQA